MTMRIGAWIAAHAEALAAAGIPSRHLPCRGLIHASLTAVDVIISGTGAHTEMGEALRRFLEPALPARRER